MVPSFLIYKYYLRLEKLLFRCKIFQTIKLSNFVITTNDVSKVYVIDIFNNITVNTCNVMIVSSSVGIPFRVFVVFVGYSVKSYYNIGISDEYTRLEY